MPAGGRRLPPSPRGLGGRRCCVCFAASASSSAWIPYHATTTRGGACVKAGRAKGRKVTTAISPAACVAPPMPHTNPSPRLQDPFTFVLAARPVSDKLTAEGGSFDRSDYMNGPGSTFQRAFCRCFLIPLTARVLPVASYDRHLSSSCSHLSPCHSSTPLHALIMNARPNHLTKAGDSPNPLVHPPHRGRTA